MVVSTRVLTSGRGLKAVEVYMATVEDTMLAKLEWGAASGSDRQMDDVIVLARSEELDRDYLDYWAAVLGVSAQLQRAF